MDKVPGEKLLDAYRYVRHDYMNHMQVIMGYLQLGNLDRAKEYAFQATHALKRYDVLSNIRLPGLAAVIIACLNTCGGSVGRNSLEIRSEGVFDSWKNEDKELTHMLEGLLHPIMESVSQGEYSCHIVLKSQHPSAVEISLQGDPDKARVLLHQASGDPVFSTEIQTPVSGVTCLIITKRYYEDNGSRA